MCDATEHVKNMITPFHNILTKLIIFFNQLGHRHSKKLSSGDTNVQSSLGTSGLKQGFSKCGLWPAAKASGKF